MHARPSRAHNACLPTNAYGDPSVSFAITAEVENTITSPKSTSRSTVPNSHLSTPTRFAIPQPLAFDFRHLARSRKLFHNLFEPAPAVLVVLKLVETRAGRRQKH